MEKFEFDDITFSEDTRLLYEGHHVNGMDISPEAFPLFMTTAFNMGNLDDVARTYDEKGYTYIRTRNPNRKSLAEFSAAVVLLSLLAVTWFWDVSGEYLRSTQEIEDFTPLPLGSLERGAYADVCNAHHSLLCWDQWEVCQIGDAGRVGDGIFWKRMDIHWYRPVLPALAEPVARSLLERAKWPGDGKWWTISWT